MWVHLILHIAVLCFALPMLIEYQEEHLSTLRGMLFLKIETLRNLTIPVVSTENRLVIEDEISGISCK